MTDEDIIRNMNAQPGQSQGGRSSRELGSRFADVDERTTADLLLFMKKLAGNVRYYSTDAPLASSSADWKPFLTYDAAAAGRLSQDNSGKVPPHLALLTTFLELYKEPQELINRFTERHLAFYYRDVLRLSEKPAVADKAHVLLELKKNAPPVKIGPANPFSAGKDATGSELVYVPTGETIINSARVDSLRSVFLDARERGAVRYAPIANSSDGTGGKLNGDSPTWYGFGHQDLPAAEVGFGLASPVLRMREGSRKIMVTLTLRDAEKLTSGLLAGAFEAFITGEKVWLGPYDASPAVRNGNTLEFVCTVPEGDPAVIDYDPAVHGYSYAAQAPVLQFLLKPGSTLVGYNDFKGVDVLKAVVKVKVSNVTSLTLENDEGRLDPKKAFVPFGAQPVRGSRFMLGCAEALGKKLSSVDISVHWKGAPNSFATLYNGYGVTGMGNNYFTAAVSFRDAGSWSFAGAGIHLFDSIDASTERVFNLAAGSSSVSPSMSEGMKVRALSKSQTQWARHSADKYVLEKPVLAAYMIAPPEPRAGFITFTLEKDFLHTTYRTKYVENVLNFSKTPEGTTITVLNEPYAPAVQSISLSYEAHSDEVNLASTALTDFSNTDVQFYHVAYFGQMREHAYQRNQFGFLTDKSVTLLPAYADQGEMLIGFKDLTAGDSVSVLFQVAEGSADPDLEHQDVQWSVLCDNYWKPLGTDGVVRDTTNQLLASGVITFVIPAEATTLNSILPGGMIWIKGSVEKNVGAICRFIQVTANAVEARFADNGNDPAHLVAALEAGKIAKLKNGSSSVKTVKQPFASFGGSPEETFGAFTTRVSERLRHKNRCVTVWDYERTVLEAFPRIHKVKCIPHAREGAWLSPGNVLIVVVPDLKNRNAVDPLEPKVDADTIDRVTGFLHERVGIQTRVKVKNPQYQKIQLDFKVKFRTGFEFNYYSAQLEKQLIQFLSPWAYGEGRDIAFGGKVYRSVLLDFVEDMDYVDYVTDFRMYSYSGLVNPHVDRNETQAEAPDAILVSAGAHTIREAD